jgi:hypothetical protein
VQQLLGAGDLIEMFARNQTDDMTRVLLHTLEGGGALVISDIEGKQNRRQCRQADQYDQSASQRYRPRYYATHDILISAWMYLRLDLGQPKSFSDD